MIPRASPAVMQDRIDELENKIEELEAELFEAKNARLAYEEGWDRAEAELEEVEQRAYDCVEIELLKAEKEFMNDRQFRDGLIVALDRIRQLKELKEKKK